MLVSNLFLKNEFYICFFPRESMFKKAKTRAKKKTRKRSDSSGGYNLSDVIQSPPSTG